MLKKIAITAMSVAGVVCLIICWPQVTLTFDDGPDPMFTPKVLEKVRAILVLHDSGGNRSSSVGALPAIIENAQAAGYRFVRLSNF